MSISFVNSASASTTTVTMPSGRQVGDLEVMWAVRDASATAPSLPVGWQTILTKSESTATACSGRLAYRICTSASDTSGTWTNATQLVCQVYRASSGNTLGIGTFASASGTSTTLNFPALTLADTSGNSWVAGFAGSSGGATFSTAPSGMTNRVGIVDAGGNDTNGGVSSWSSTNVTITAAKTVSCTVEIVLLPNNAGSSNLSNLYQCVAMAGLNQGQGLTCQNLKIPMPNPSGAGNCVVLCITYPNGTTLTITDNLDTWPGSPSLHANAGSGNLDSAIYVLPNCSSGQRLVNVAFSTAPSTVQYTIYEFYGIATTSPVNGSTNTAFAAAPNLACGSFTPTNNNSNGGNLILAYYPKATPGTSQASFATKIYQLGTFTPVNADVANLSAGGFDQASSLYLQATSAAINPKATAVGDTDDWNSCAIALAISPGSGTAPQSGIRLNKLTSQCGFPQAAAGYSLHCPASGNLRVIGCPDPNITFGTITIADNEGNLYTADGNEAGFWYFPNSSRNDNLVITITNYGGDNLSSWFFWDISGAATSPFDSSVQENLSLGTTFTFSPDPDPTTTTGITIGSVGLGTGPALSVTAPSGAIWDVPNYTGKTDQDTMNNADFQAHFYYSSSGSQTWSGTCSVATSADLGGFISFEAAPVSSPTWTPTAPHIRYVTRYNILRR